jgi:hypothetical protein
LGKPQAGGSILRNRHVRSSRLGEPGSAAADSLGSRHGPSASPFSASP